MGQFGTGKTEIAIALSRKLAAEVSPVYLVDLDVVTPYFRPRDLRNALEAAGVQVIAPAGEAKFTELPAITARAVDAMVEGCAGRTTVVVDVGGGPDGARVLAMMAARLTGPCLRVVHVLNRCRLSAVADIPGLIGGIESASRLPTTHLASNTHLLGASTLPLVIEGIRWAMSVSRDVGIPLLFASVPAELEDKVAEQVDGLPLVAVERSLSLPWEVAGGLVEACREECGPT